MAEETTNTGNEPYYGEEEHQEPHYGEDEQSGGAQQGQGQDKDKDQAEMRPTGSGGSAQPSQ